MRKISDKTADAKAVTVQRRVSWQYHRDKINRVSKWMLGNNWVTKWDKDRFCIIGFQGARTDWKVDDPKAAREAVEYALMPANVGFSDAVRKDSNAK